MPLELVYRAADEADDESADETLPVELEGFTPDRFRGASLDAIRRHRAFVGNTTVEVGELFTVAGDPADGNWRLAGDLSGVHYLGAGMTAGTMRIDGAAGRHAGALMQGGELRIAGDAGDWLGAEMRGGAVEVTGNAGDHAAGAYAGSRVGMRGGSVVVRGDAGDQTAASMRRGQVIVGGRCGSLAGYRMRAGTLFAFGGCGPRPGAEMLRGTIGLFGSGREGSQRPALLPTFRYACRYAPAVLGLLGGELAKLGYDVPRTVDLYSGDLLTGGRGEILVPVA